MMINNTIKIAAITVFMSLLIGCNSIEQANVPEKTAEGMLLVKSTDSTTAYKKSGVDFTAYENIFILPSQVAVKKNWKRTYNHDQGNASQRLNDDDVSAIETKVASLFDKVFKEEMSKGSTKKVIDKHDATTLILKPFVINLDLNAPNVQTASNIRTYVKETGEATLYLEIFDGGSGEILARVIDDAIIGNDSFVQWASRARNNADTIRTIRKWAKSLNAEFDKTQTK